MNASLISIFQFNPKQCTAAVAQWRLAHLAVWVKAAKDRKTLSDDARNATLSALTQANPALEGDLQLLSATSDASGSDDTTVDILETIQVQFWEALSPEVKAQIPRPVPL